MKTRSNTAKHTVSTFRSTTDHSYSRDRNLWHISHEGLELEDPANEPNYDNMLVLGVTPEKAPDEGEYVTMTFEKGVPKTVNGKAMKVSDIITDAEHAWRQTWYRYRRYRRKPCCWYEIPWCI